MTFVAQPFEQFVDDLLTALTGGFVREEHRFESAEEPYPIAAASAVPGSVRIVGQRGGAYHAFTPGLDFEYVPGDAAVQWIEEGARPDDRSFFYVSYYPTEGTRRLTDRNVGSVTRTLAEAFSRQFAVLHQQMQLIYRSAFLETASDASLDHVASLLDVRRRDARFASGEVLFKRSTPAPATIAVPSGTLVSTREGTTFETTEERRLRRGQLSVAVPIRARLPGTEGAVAAERITLLNEPLFGIEGVLNTESTRFDAARETDQELRRRIRGALARAGGATRRAILQTLIQDVPDVNETNVRLVERTDEPGLVELQFGLADVDERTVARIEDAILRSRPVGVRVVHNLGSGGSAAATATSGTAAARLTEEGHGPSPVEDLQPSEELVSPPPELLAKLPTGILPLRLEVLYRLADPTASASERDDIEDAIRERVLAYVDQLGMGSDLIHSKLLGRVVEPDEIRDARVRVGIQGGAGLEEGNLATADRKATVLDAQHDVFVGSMWEVVEVGVAIAVESVGDAGGHRDLARWESTLKEVLAAGLPERNVGRLTANDVERLARTALEEAPYRLASDRAVSLTASFEDSGRFLSGPEVIDLASHQRIVFRGVTLEVGSPLDG